MRRHAREARCALDACGARSTRAARLRSTEAKPLRSTAGPLLWRLHHVILDPAIVEPAVGIVVAGNRVGAAVAFGDEHVRLDTALDQQVTDRLRALL